LCGLEDLRIGCASDAKVLHAFDLASEALHEANGPRERALVRKE
jgi:hypothetical protein